MSRQLDWYRKNALRINEAKRAKRKAIVKPSSKAVLQSKRKAVKPSQSVKPFSSDSSYINNAPKQIRFHAYGKRRAHIKPMDTIAIEGRLADANIRYGYERMRNTIFYFFDYEGLKMRLTTLSLSAWVPELDVPTDPKALEEARATQDKTLDTALETAKERLNLNLEQESTIFQDHIAFQRDEYAIDVISNRHKIVLKDETDKRERAKIDASKTEVDSGLKIPETEFVHKKHAFNDSMKYARLLEHVYKGDFSVEKYLEALKATNETINNVVENQKMQMLTTETLTKAIAEVTEALKTLRDKLNNR